MWSAINGRFDGACIFLCHFAVACSPGKVVGTRSAGFQPNDLRIGGTPMAMTGPCAPK